MEKKQKNKKIGLLISVILLMAIIVAVMVLVSQNQKSVTVYEFTRTIKYSDKANYALTGEDITEAEMMAADVTDDIVTNKDAIIGKYIKGDCFKGQHVLTNMIQSEPTYVNKSGISELADYRKIFLQVNYATAFAGDIKPGDLVDLMFLENSSGMTTSRTQELWGPQASLDYTSARVFMQSVPVFQVYTAKGQVFNRRETTPTTLGSNKGTTADGKEEIDYLAPAFVALSVTLPQYEEISARMERGTVSLVSRYDESQDVETNGYLILKSGTANIYTGEGNLEFDANVKMDGENTNTYEGGIEKVAEEEKQENLGLYSFIKKFGTYNLTSEEQKTYKDIWGQYSEYMKAYSGEDWEINLPDSVTLQQLRDNIDPTDTTAMNQFLAWQDSMETFAKKIMGADANIPY